MEAPAEPLNEDELAAWIEHAWNDADRLRRLILDSLEEGRGREVLAAAERLPEIEDDLDRGVVVHSLVLRSCAQHERAEFLLRRHLKARGGSADIWFALAPLSAWRGEEAEVNAALDRALSYDPEHIDALEWGYKYQRRHYGDRWAGKWLSDRSADSWVARVMLGEYALEHGEAERALELFTGACRLRPHRAGPLARSVRALTGKGRDAEAARMVVTHWTGPCGPWPLVWAIEADLRLGRAGDAALLLARLRGLPLSKELYPVMTDIAQRVNEACREAGL